MKFGDFELFTHLIWIVPLILVFFLWAMRKESIIMQRFAQKDLIAAIAPFYSRDRRNIRIALNLVAVFMIIFALARPQWGFFWKEEKNKGLDIIIAMDTSNSMLARDITPNRLSFAKMEVRDFVRRLKGDRFGLIAFSGEAFLQCPLTVDYGGFFVALDGLDEETILQGGTSMASAIDEAVKAYEGAVADNKVLIIITDGENTVGDLAASVKKAKNEGVMICCIGIGTTRGEKIPVLDDKGSVKYLTDKEGRVVTSRLEEKTLKMIAAETGGIYARASQSDFGLSRIYRERLEKLEKKETEDRKVKVYKERFQFPLGVVVLFLFAEMVLRGRSVRKKLS